LETLIGPQESIPSLVESWECSQIGCHLFPRGVVRKMFQNKIEIYFKMFQMLKLRERFVN
jgi:hypothetical protein